MQFVRARYDEPMTMKACILRETKPIVERPLDYTEVARPTPRCGQVLIRVRACGVCRTDLHVVEGDLDRARQRMPVIPGHQIVGEVVEVGEDNNPLPQGEGGERREPGEARASRGGHDTLRRTKTTLTPDPSPGGRGEIKAGDRVGVAWLHSTCGECPYCLRGEENLCDRAQFTGWTCDGGYAKYVLAERDFVYRLPASMSDLEVAPLLCAGIIGYRCLRKCALKDWHGARLGLYGFGAAGHIAIQIARARGAEVYVCTRDERHRNLARELGAAWVGGAVDPPPVKLDASIIFAPAGEIVPPALRALDKGGVLVLGGIHMSPIPQIEYRDLYWERSIRSVANNVRADGEAFLKEAADVGITTSIETFPLREANDALIRLKEDAILGAAVLVV